MTYLGSHETETPEVFSAPLLDVEQQQKVGSAELIVQSGWTTHHCAKSQVSFDQTREHKEKPMCVPGFEVIGDAVKATLIGNFLSHFCFSGHGRSNDYKNENHRRRVRADKRIAGFLFISNSETWNRNVSVAESPVHQS
jgi:hypothetical protein